MKTTTLSCKSMRAGSILAALALSACSSGQISHDASLSISPEDRVISVVENLDADGRCRFDPQRHVDLPVVFSLRDGQGSPIGDAEISVYVDFAANTFGGYPALAVYDDRNSNGVVDDAELISGAEHDIARVMTDQFAGDRMLLLRVNLSCAYRGTVFAFVEGATASAFIEIRSTEDAVPSTDAEVSST